jgi:hypothetical protein
MEVTNDHYTALTYAYKAREAVREFQESIKTWHRECVKRTYVVNNDLAKRLRADLEAYDLRIMKELEDWLADLRRLFENNIAYAIANTELMPKEDDARRYSQAAVEAEPDNGAYIDTLGLVKLTFGIAHRKREDVKDALRLFNRVAYDYARSGNNYERKLIRLHLKRARSALRTISDWDR